MSHPRRDEALAKIAQNIKDHGFHLYLISGAQSPRFAYTIGLRESLGIELALPGAIYFMKDDVSRIVHGVRKRLQARTGHPSTVSVWGLGQFSLRRAHGSWTELLLLGALDYYDTRDVEAYQIVPDDAHWTIDVPDMSRPYDPAAEPVWRWQREPWTYDLPVSSRSAIFLDALRGAPITHVARYEEDYWEVQTAKENLPKKQMRIVPLGCLIGADPSLEVAATLKVNQGLCRDDGGDWEPWFDSSNKR